MIETFLAAFVTLFVVIDPPGIAPIFAVMTTGQNAAYKRKMVFKATITATIILLMFAFIGQGLLSGLGISMAAFRTAGGFMLFLIAMEMVFEKRTERREKKAEHDDFYDSLHDEPEDISVFPLAIPFMSGPGSIATIMLLMSEASGDFTLQGLTIAALLTALLSTVIILLLAGKIMDLLGHTVANAITRILGVILAALATQYMFDGIKVSFLGA
ncbi:MarC family protein [Emcibacter sp.]|uniref:MarC family protein n=1 Tax=Emcibacter sp. TaxID=1979954 RepID=UPI002AA76F3A|nr:MarC family protein [Emcibacter sp.]